VNAFEEKPKGDKTWINGGFFVCEPQIFDTISGDMTFWERDPMENLAQQNQMAAFLHDGFWRPMDTLRDKNDLEEIWNAGNAPWKIW
jgi:glucose-1-phosphate cytidylyltransferase